MLIFDSGIGGLSVLSNIKKKLPKVNYIYVADNESFPYGEKSENFIIERSIKIIQQIKNKYPIKIVIVACNTASTISLSFLKKMFNIPIIGILPNLTSFINIKKNKNIGFIGTHATINSIFFKKMIKKLSYKNKIKIIATNKLAMIAEKKIRKIFVPNIKIKAIFQPWINLSDPINTIILGCTHFSFLEKEIKSIFDYNKSINLINTYEDSTIQIQEKFLKKVKNQKIKKNIFLYSQYNKQIDYLILALKKYNFNTIKKINLN